MKKASVVAAIVALLLCTSQGWALDLTPGLYSITSKVEMEGMGMSMPATTMEQCITEEDPVPNATAEAEGCEMKDMEVSGNTVAFTMVCEQQGMTMKTVGETIYHGDSFAGGATMTMGDGAGSMVMKSTIEGRRIGECQ